MLPWVLPAVTGSKVDISPENGYIYLAPRDASRITPSQRWRTP